MNLHQKKEENPMSKGGLQKSPPPVPFSLSAFSHPSACWCFNSSSTEKSRTDNQDKYEN